MGKDLLEPGIEGAELPPRVSAINIEVKTARGEER
jgi:hypothetical protein